MAIRIPFSAKDLKKQNTKAEYIRFDREDAFGCILGSHVAAEMICQKLLYMVDLCYRCPNKVMNLCYTYYVPTTLLVVLSSVLFELNIFASPRSEILGFISLSKRMLLGLRSRCMTRNRECLCRQRSPSAIPSIISRRLFQSNKVFLVSSACASPIECQCIQQETCNIVLRHLEKVCYIYYM